MGSPSDTPDRVLIIPGLNGYAGMLADAAPDLFPGMDPRPFDHRVDEAEGGVDGLAEQAMGLLSDDDAPAYICGESFGGTVALTIARRWPERVAGLILFSTFGWYPGVASRGGQAGLAIWRVLGDGIGKRLFRAGRMVSLPGQLGFRANAGIVNSYVTRPAPQLSAYRTKCQLSLNFDARPWLGTLTCPAFVLIGTWDPVVPPSAGRYLARHIPHAGIHQLPGGHLVHLVRSVEAGRLIHHWRQRLVVSEAVDRHRSAKTATPE